MRKHSSVFILLIRNKIYRVLFILLAMSAVSILGFRFSGFMDAPMFGEYYGTWFLGATCLLGYVGCVISCTEFASAKSRRAYTYQRLRVSEREILFWDVLTNMLIFFVLYGTEIIILGILAKMYAAAPGYVQGEQGIIAAFYRSAFLHGMIPMAESGLWIRNILLVPAVSILCSCASVDMRYNSKPPILIFFLEIILVLCIPSDPGQGSYLLAICGMISAISLLVNRWVRSHNGKRRGEDA